MASLLKIAAYFLLTLVLGALLAPPLFWAGHALGGAWKPAAWLAQTDFQRYFDRAMFLAALVLLPPAIRALHIAGWRDLGLARNPHAARHVLGGFLLSGGLLWLLGIFLFQRGIYGVRDTPLNPGGFGGLFVGAAAVAALEESFFRGALQGLVARTMRPGAALGFVAALFAILHFLKPPEHAVDVGDVRWTTGFAFLPKTFWQWGDGQLVIGGLTTLLLVGLVLGYARWRTQSLWLPIGLHAGWVFGLKSFSKASKHLVESNRWFGGDLLHGLGPIGVVLITGALVWAALNLGRESDLDRITPDK